MYIQFIVYNSSFPHFPSQEPQGAYSKLSPKDLYDDLDLLEEKDLLEFSRQIAAGMVSV